MSDITPKIIREFRAYHTLNPKVYGLFKENTFNLINLGKTRGMALGILYNIRWEVDFAVRGDFKLFGNYSADI